MSSVQELSSGMLVCDFSWLFRKIASYKKNPFFFFLLFSAQTNEEIE